MGKMLVTGGKWRMFNTDFVLFLSFIFGLIDTWLTWALLIRKWKEVKWQLIESDSFSIVDIHMYLGFVLFAINYNLHTNANY